MPMSGGARLPAMKLLQAVFPNSSAPAGAKKSKPGEVKPIPFAAYRSISYNLGQCCIPCRRSHRGINNPGEGLVIHTIDCAELDRAHNMDDWLDVGWGRGASTWACRWRASRCE